VKDSKAFSRSIKRSASKMPALPYTMYCRAACVGGQGGRGKRESTEGHVGCEDGMG
jgi:hypothetical protein